MSKARNLAGFISDATVEAAEIADNAITNAKVAVNAIASENLIALNITHDKLHTNMDLSTKTITLAADAISGNNVHSGTISDFASTGIDDNATSTVVTVASTGKVGVGATVPGNHLTVYAASATTLQLANATTTAGAGDGLLISQTGDNAVISNAEAGYLKLKTNGSDRLTITSAGNVGIGTASPTYPLHIVSTVPAITLEDTSGDSFQMSNNNGKWRVRNNTDSRDDLTITGGGKVGIGTSSPSTKVHIVGSSSDTVSQATANLQIEGGGGNGVLIGTKSTGFDSYIQAGFMDNLGTATYDLLLNPAGGNVGIGTSSADSLLHLQKFDATAYSATATDGQVGVGPTLYLENPANSNATVGGQIVFGMRSTEAQARIGATGGASPALTFGTGDAERMRIDSAGRVTMPYQPAFGTRGVTFTDTIYKGGSITANIGSHFSASTGRFTAPVAGSYLFNFTLSTNDGDSHFVDLYKNGAGTLGHNLQYGNIYHTGSMTIVIWLAVGDYMEARRRGSTYAVYNAQFSGHLIG